MREVVIIDAVRSPIGRHNGGLSSVRPDDLLAKVLEALMERTGVDPALVEDVFSGCGNQAGEDNRDVARTALLLAGFPIEVSGVTVNRNCSLGLEAVNLAAKSIIAGEGEIAPKVPQRKGPPNIRLRDQGVIETWEGEGVS